MRLKNKAAKEIRLGETRHNGNGSNMWIVEYVNSKDITVEFSNGFTTKARYQNFCKGSVSNPYDLTVFGVGYLGTGDYRAYINGQATPGYRCWKSMLERCYSPKLQEKYQTYKGCSVCEEWHNFQTFAKWYDENYYEIEGQRVCLEKDIIHRGNKVYSPTTCCFAPHEINCLFVKCDAVRGEYFIGVYFHKQRNKYVAQCENGTGAQQYLGLFTTPEEAFNVYKECKTQYIKQVAEKHKTQIPERLYKAMMEYQVEITD